MSPFNGKYTQSWSHRAAATSNGAAAHIFLNTFCSYSSRNSVNAVGPKEGCVWILGQCVNKHSWLVSNLGTCLSALIWLQQIVFMAAPWPSIRPATEDLPNSSRGHVVTTETAFESTHINNTGCWHETKRERKMGERGMNQARVGCVRLDSSLSKTILSQALIF